MELLLNILPIVFIVLAIIFIAFIIIALFSIMRLSSKLSREEEQCKREIFLKKDKNIIE